MIRWLVVAVVAALVVVGCAYLPARNAMPDWKSQVGEKAGEIPVVCYVEDQMIPVVLEAYYDKDGKPGWVVQTLGLPSQQASDEWKMEKNPIMVVKFNQDASFNQAWMDWNADGKWDKRFATYEEAAKETGEAACSVVKYVADKRAGK